MSWDLSDATETTSDTYEDSSTSGNSYWSDNAEQMEINSAAHHRPSARARCRRWGALPQDLMDKIIEKAEVVGGQRALYSMRLVSTAWHDAIRGYAGTLWGIHFYNPDQLAILHWIMPGLKSLGVTTSNKALDLRGLTTLTGLTHLSLAPYSCSTAGPERELWLDLAALPSSLSSLDLKCSYIDPARFQFFQCSGLTTLSLHYGESARPQISRLLQCLPKLEELHLDVYSGSQPVHRNSLSVNRVSAMPDGLDHFFSESSIYCQGLTRLELSNGNFLAGGTWQFYVPPKLKEVSFKNMNLDTSWLNVFTWSTPGLGQLKLETCKLRGRYNEKWEDKETPLKPMRSLRTLILKDSWCKYYPGLARQGLQSFSWTGTYEYDSSPERLLRVARFTALTRLELSDFGKAGDKSLKALRRLRLQELVLLDCVGLEGQLFVPFALQQLRRLHIEDSTGTDKKASHEDRQRRLDHKCALKDLGKAVFQLPQLYQLSGMCSLFQIGMKEGLRSWQEVDCPDGTMVSDSSYHKCHVDWLRLWIKPGSS